MTILLNLVIHNTYVDQHTDGVVVISATGGWTSVISTSVVLLTSASADVDIVATGSWVLNHVVTWSLTTVGPTAANLSATVCPQAGVFPVNCLGFETVKLPTTDASVSLSHPKVVVASVSLTHPEIVVAADSGSCKAQQLDIIIVSCEGMSIFIPTAFIRKCTKTTNVTSLNRLTRLESVFHQLFVCL